jgi:hypothetical protein
VIYANSIAGDCAAHPPELGVGQMSSPLFYVKNPPAIYCAMAGMTFGSSRRRIKTDFANFSAAATTSPTSFENQLDAMIWSIKGGHNQFNPVANAGKPV